MRSGLRALFLALVLLLVSSFAGGPASAATQAAQPSRVPIIVPEAHDLKLLSFWVALGSGFFQDEGFDLQVMTPERPSQAEAMFTSGSAPLAVLSGGSYERLIEQHLPFVIAANLLASDPYDLVVKREFGARAKITPGLTPRRRLELLQGARIGVAPAARARLSLLFREQGLDANDVRLVPLRADELVPSLAAGHLDGVYTDTPQLEKALLDGDSVMVIDAAAGDVPAFSERMVEALVVNEVYAKEPGRLAALSRAVGKAERLLRNDRGAAEAAVLRALPGTDRRLLSYLISLYAPAIPPSPHVEPRLIAREQQFFLTGSEGRLPDSVLAPYAFDDGSASAAALPMGKADTNTATNPRSGGEPRYPSPSSPSHRIVFLCGLFALLVALAAAAFELREAKDDVG
jgi:ABC-type nitrate/sulfonate/bicarbonate transport system substrate-binding protein